MHTKALLLASIPAATAAETILGAYIFSRHGDRTTKAYSPAKLTALGAEQVYRSGSWYRSRYIDSRSSTRINGISSDLADLSELSVTAPVDNVLQGSAGIFLQGLYPPAGSVNSQKLANGTTIEAPLSGYQYIPVNTAAVTSSAQAESNAWLQGNSGCPAAVNSSQAYFQSKEYLELLESTKEFYQNLLPVYESTFSSETATFKNAYSLYDYIHVATIHNSSIPSSNLLTPSTLQTLSDLANIHEFSLAYNASSPIRAVAGSVLASHIVSTLNSSVSAASKQKLNIQFGPYGTFASFFGLTQLPAVSNDFTSIVDYASSMTFELFTKSASSSPDQDEVFVRFLFANGTASDSNPAKAYPLFGQDKTELPWTTFVAEMNKIALEGGSKEWCEACGEKTGSCAAYYPAAEETASVSEAKKGGMSNAVAGVIGAMVTLGVVLGLQALILGVGGLRLTKRRKQQQGISEVFHVSAEKTSFSDTSSVQKA
ncbi:histidine phosphatase superfamily [Pseudoneurospora amorphoporcata]|uniref:Histidine phosphatase superfamily n=1 Tax=Pseudoneurospora amorphoporcata TaxID=241081 RepID=A0AAN6P2K7_9PEZI|nr:histidine phosphatase superfamily [Pseudoneurospora amorphoporcata]